MRRYYTETGEIVGYGRLAPRLQQFFVPRAHSVIIFGALLCTVAVKLFHARRYSLTDEYFDWILADIAVLLATEALLSLLCFRYPKKWIVRLVLIFAALVCTWSVINAGWLIRTGTQILPRVLLSLFRAPVSALSMVGVNLAKMPAVSVVLLGPSFVALVFFFVVLARPAVPLYSRRSLLLRVVLCLSLVLATVIARRGEAARSSFDVASVGLRYNAQLRALTSLLVPRLTDQGELRRAIPPFDHVGLIRSEGAGARNVILVVLEGIQYEYTSLGDPARDQTPCLARLAGEGVEFSNARSCLTHTTKALFSLLTGRYPSASQDIAEAVPAPKAYASVATILRDHLGYRTGFFQSAVGSFEARPGLVQNLGFGKFWARDDLGDPNTFVGYLGSDEFAMLEPVSQWIKAAAGPFFLTILCSVTHDPYEVPPWFAAPAKEPQDRYCQAIAYTDRFLAALDVELVTLGLVDETILCVVGDHGEAFGEHGLLGHERIAFDEVLRIPFCVRAPSLLDAGGEITRPVSSVDVAPTLLGLLGFETECVGFDGENLLGPFTEERRVYFCGWMEEGPAGFVKGSRKFVYNPASKAVYAYDLRGDPLELGRIELSGEKATEIAREITSWRNGTVFRLGQQRTGKEVLFEHWSCRWTNRVASAKYEE